MGTDNPYPDVAEAGWLLGWRLDEILSLMWVGSTTDEKAVDGPRGVVDREAGLITLYVTKTDRPRTWPLRDRRGRLTAVGRLMEKRWKARRYLSGKQGDDDTRVWRVSRFAFHVSGHKLWRFGRIWRLAREAAGLPGRLFHDYRRSTGKRLSDAGVSETTIMQMCGWKTPSMFRRYIIVNEDDKLDALDRLEEHEAAERGRKASGQ